MLLKAGLKLCPDKRCLNSEEKAMSLESVIHTEPGRYCHLCVDNGFDYVYTNNVLCDPSGQVVDNPKRDKHRPIEESLYLQKIRRRGLLRKSTAPFGLFSKREYAPNEVIGFLSGVVIDVQDRPTPASSEGGECCRCFLIREKNLAIDSRQVGNLARFIRRSCRPNVGLALEGSDEWQSCPPLKKLSRRLGFTQVKLYAISRIYANSELLVGTAYGAQGDESWHAAQGSAVPLSPAELQTTCSSPMRWTCVCEKDPAAQAPRRISEHSNVSPFFARLHKYVNTGASLSSADISFLLANKCVFIK